MTVCGTYSNNRRLAGWADRCAPPIRSHVTPASSAPRGYEPASSDHHAAYERYNALPISDHSDIADRPEERAQWDIIDGADGVTPSAVANSPRGAAIQLWTV